MSLPSTEKKEAKSHHHEDGMASPASDMKIEVKWTTRQVIAIVSLSILWVGKYFTASIKHP